MNSIVVDLFFGDSGKGATTDYLVRQKKAEWNVRYSGGPQCAHRVVDGGKSHIFHQYGSGTFAGAKTLFAPTVLFDPHRLNNEYRQLAALGVKPEIFIHEDCPVVTIGHIIKSQRDAAATGHGSTGSGCWVAWEEALTGADVLRAKDLKTPEFFDKWKASIRKFAPGETCDYEYILNQDFSLFQVVDDNWIADNVNSNLVFEGNQGVLLDPDVGFSPYITANSCTAENALAFISRYCKDKSSEVVGVMRHYFSRHGPGPFPSETKEFNIDEFNPPGTYTGPMRYGHFDRVLFEYVMNLIRPDILAVNCLDQDTPAKHVYDYANDVDFTLPHEERTQQLFEAAPLISTRHWNHRHPKMISGFGADHTKRECNFKL